MCFSLNYWDQLFSFICISYCVCWTPNGARPVCFDKLEINDCPLESDLQISSSFIFSSLSLSKIPRFVLRFHYQVFQLLLWFLLWWAEDKNAYFFCFKITPFLKENSGKWLHGTLFGVECLEYIIHHTLEANVRYSQIFFWLKPFD